MPRYAEDSKEKVRDAVDFLALVSQYTEMRKAGAVEYTGLCPFHEERTPSFGVNPSKKVFSCFGCGVSGDVFNFVMMKEGLDFPGALELLAERSGVELEIQDEDPAAAQRRATRERLLELLERTAAFYVRHLWDSDEAANARAYLEARGLTEQLLREFRVGYSPSRFDSVLLPSRKAGYSEKELLDAGLVVKSERSGGRVYDRFRGRIMFPLCDRRGRVLGFGARRLRDDDQGPKYLNSNDGVVFHKGQNLYAADIARAHASRAGAVILAEGYTDVIALHQAGLRNSVGLMGTALTAEQVTELSRLAPVVQLALDADSAGQEAIARAEKVARGRNVQLRVVSMPAGSDPADLIQAEGPDPMRERVAASVPFVSFQVDRELARGDLRTAEGQDAVIDALRPVFHELPPGALREELERKVADATDLKYSIMAKRLAEPVKNAGRAVSPPAAPVESERAAPLRPSPLPGGQRARMERSLLTEVVARPEEGRKVLETLDLDSTFIHEIHRRAARHLLAQSDPSAGIPVDDIDLSSLIAGLMMRARDHAASAASLDAELAKLRLADIERRIAESRAAGEAVAELAAERVAVQSAMNDALTRAQEEAPASSHE